MKFIKKLFAKNGTSYFWCPDGKRHEKEYFDHKIPVWNCNRCGCKHGATGLGMAGFLERGKLSSKNKE